MDIALVPALELPNWVDGKPVFRSSFSVIARQGNDKLARAGVRPGDVISIDLFCGMGHVLFSPEGKPAAVGDATLARVGRGRRVVMTMPVFSGVYGPGGGSELIALMPDQMARRVAASVGLEIYAPPMPIEPVQIMMIWNRRYSAWPAHA